MTLVPPRPSQHLTFHGPHLAVHSASPGFLVRVQAGGRQPELRLGGQERLHHVSGDLASPSPSICSTLFSRTSLLAHLNPLLRTSPTSCSGGAIITTFFAFLIGCFSLGQMAPTFKAVADARASLVRVMGIVRREPAMDSMSSEGKKLDSVRGEIEFDVEDFAYPARPLNRVCDHYRLSVKPGETVALVGPS